MKKLLLSFIIILSFIAPAKAQIKNTESYGCQQLRKLMEQEKPEYNQQYEEDRKIAEALDKVNPNRAAELYKRLCNKNL